MWGISDVFKESFETLKELPKEVGTEAVGQAKGGKKQAGDQGGSQSDQNQQQFLEDLYGASDISGDQLEQKKKQDGRVKISNYKKIQQEIAEYRAKKGQQKTKYEIGWQEGAEAARNQEEEMELWQKQQKKMEEKKKKEEQINAPGGAAGKSGEQGKVMG